jgi:hypothetical protein
MEKELKELVAIARRYIEFATAVGQKQGWVDYKADNPVIEVYQYRTSPSSFRISDNEDEYEINLSSQEMTLPLNIQAIDIKDLVEESKKHLEYLKSNKKEEMIKEAEEAKQMRIEILEKELKELKS